MSCPKRKDKFNGDSIDLKTWEYMPGCHGSILIQQNSLTGIHMITIT